jgi:glucose-6-phosphate 1-epimerase
MASSFTPEPLRQHEIPGRVAIANGDGRLPKVVVTTKSSTAEIYLHGAHVTHFQKNGEPPLLFLSARSHFAAAQPIRGGVPICFPWFGNREGGPSHGFARITEWQLVKTAVAPDGAVTLQLALPGIAGSPAWNSLRTDFFVMISDTLTMEITVANESREGTLEIENCLHTYLHVGDISAVSLAGLEGMPFDDFAFSAGGARRPASNTPLHVTQETNRVYPHHAGVVEIRDEAFRRTIRVEKFNSHSTVVWNPWTTQKMPGDFDPAEHRRMVCVESGNVKQNKILLAQGKTAALKVVLSSKGF